MNDKDLLNLLQANNFDKETIDKALKELKNKSEEEVFAYIAEIETNKATLLEKQRNDRIEEAERLTKERLEIQKKEEEYRQQILDNIKANIKENNKEYKQNTKKHIETADIVVKYSFNKELYKLEFNKEATINNLYDQISKKHNTNILIKEIKTNSKDDLLIKLGSRIKLTVLKK